MKKVLLPVLAGMGILMTAVAANAMEVRISGEMCALTAGTTLGEDSQPVNVETMGFEVYGYMQGDLIAVNTGEAVVYVTREELEGKLPDIPTDRLPSAEGLAELTGGAHSEGVVKLQQNLIDTGYLEGTADGGYGPMTMNAVKKFQAEHRLAETGVADIYTQMVLQAAADGLPDVLETTYPTVHSPEEKFAAIISKTDADLDRYMSSEWKFSYDELEKEGLLDPSVVLGTYDVTESAADIDKIAMTASLKIRLEEDGESGKVLFTPVLCVESRGAYRPYLKDVIFGIDGGAVKSEPGTSGGELEGASLKESGYVVLSDEMLEILASKTLKVLRVEGQNQSYDLAFGAEELAAGAGFAAAVR